jgi:hypothetical protein
VYELPLAAVVFAPKLDAARQPTRFADWRPYRARPMIAHECKIAGRNNFFRLKFNASLTIGHSE